MKFITVYILLILIIFSCENEKKILLPEISHSNITDVNDVSPGYLFYNESTNKAELNRKNLINTTNWLINVDKRLTLKQVIPQIRYLQEKKKNSTHIKEGVKNYYTCNNTSTKNLGFIDFSNTNYCEQSLEKYGSEHFKSIKNNLVISFGSLDTIIVINANSKTKPIIKTNTKGLISVLKKLDLINTNVILNFYNNLLFQEYITYKSVLSNVNFKHLRISNQEFLHY